MIGNDKDKWKSRRWLLALWASLSITFLLVYGLIYRPEVDWVASVINFLITIILAYMGSETITKNSFIKYNNNKGDIDGEAK